MASQADIRSVDNAIAASQTVSGEIGLSFWDRIKIAVVPESYGESIVNEIYGSAARTLHPDPYYDSRDVSSPNVYVRAKGAIGDVASALTGFGGKALWIIGGLLILAIVLNAAIPALIRR